MNVKTGNIYQKWAPWTMKGHSKQHTTALKLMPYSVLILLNIILSSAFWANQPTKTLNNAIRMMFKKSSIQTYFSISTKLVILSSHLKFSGISFFLFCLSLPLCNNATKL